MKFRTSIFLLFAILVAGCSKQRDETVVAKQGAAVLKDLVYGTDYQQQTMDVYLPAGRTTSSTTVVILLHGGAWYTGKKEDFDWIKLDSFFNERNCAVVNMNYSLDRQYTYPAPLDDIATVIQFISKKAREWKINTSSICLLGRSSGAHLAMMYAYTRNTDKKVKVVMDFYGPTNLTDSTIKSGPLGGDVAELLGSYETHPASWRNESPIANLSTAIPTIIYQGDADVLVSPKQSQMLYDSLSARGIPVLYYSSKNQGHGWPVEKWNETCLAAFQWMKYFL